MRQPPINANIPAVMSIYDVLRELANAIPWREEGVKLRILQGIQHAQDNRLFGTEGDYKL